MCHIPIVHPAALISQTLNDRVLVSTYGPLGHNISFVYPDVLLSAVLDGRGPSGAAGLRNYAVNTPLIFKQ